MLRVILTASAVALFAGAALAQDPSASPSAAASAEASAAPSPAAEAGHEGHSHGPGGHGAEATIDPSRIGLGGAPEELGPPNAALKDQKTKASYALGFKFGTDLSNALKRMDIAMDIETMLMGVKDAVNGAKPSLAIKEMEKSVEGHVTESRKAIADKNKKEGDDYLAENKKKPNVKTTASGLQYEVITEGKGPMPTDKDTVSTNYRGTLINGTEFDSSYKRKEPTTFPVSGVIPGWSEALKLMPVGSKWKLAIPSDLAYGAQGAGGKIGPNSTLLFEVELIEIKKEGGDAAPASDASPSAEPSAEPAASPSAEK